MIWLAFTAVHAATPTHQELETAAWKPLSERDHADAGTIRIATATLQGIECYRAEADATDVPADVFLGILSNPPSAKDWASADITEAEVLDKSADRVDYYQHLKVPGWTMVSDRFWFSRGTIDRTPTRLAWRYQKLQDGGPYHDRWLAHKQRHPNAIEPVHSVGGWYFEPTGSGTRITYAMCADIGGSIPAAVERYATRRTLPDTVGDVVREGRRRHTAK